MTGNFEVMRDGIEPSGEIDLRALGAALRRRLRLLVTVALAACLLIAIAVNVITARYTAQSQILLENEETFFTRPDRVNVQQVDQAQQLDPEAVASQVQLITSRDIARRAIKQLGLEGNDEFDPKPNPFKRVLVLLGLMSDQTQETRDSRIVTSFLDKLVVYSPPKTRVIAIEFTSRDPMLAARAANAVATLYLKSQSDAKRQQAQETADSLAAQTADLRARLVKADDAREQYRLQTGLLAGSNNMTITGQQLADINTDLSKARTAQADAQAKAQMIRDLVKRGVAADVTDVINNETVRRIAEQRVQVEGQLALESRTLLPGHPRIKALMAQVQEYDRALKGAAKQAATTLENEATIAGARVKNLESVLSQQKTLAGTANVDEVHLRTLERAADSLKDQLDSSTTKYQEALARASSDATPADARIIQRAAPPQEPSFPKKLPFIVFGTLAALVLAVGFVAASELMGAAEPATVVEVARQESRVEPLPAVQEPVQAPVQAPVQVPSAVVWDDTVPKRHWLLRSRRTRVEPAAVAVPAEPAIVEPEDDLVFAEPSIEQLPQRRTSNLRGLIVGGVLGTIVARARAFGRSAAASRADRDVEHDTHHDSEELAAASQGGVGWDAEPVRHDASAKATQAKAASAKAAPAEAAPAEATTAVDEQHGIGDVLTDRIVAAHVPGHGLHIVCACVATETPNMLVGLARNLADKGRTVVVDLDRTPSRLAPLVRSGDDASRDIASRDIAGLVGLSELLVGDASFAEVIHRDHTSRLHFIPTGRQEADFRDFDLILDALTATYDFIVLLAPAYPQSEIAKIMAPYADFVVLAPGDGHDEAALTGLERELTDAGARTVLVAGRAQHKLSLHVA